MILISLLHTPVFYRSLLSKTAVKIYAPFLSAFTDRAFYSYFYSSCAMASFFSTVASVSFTGRYLFFLRYGFIFFDSRFSVLHGQVFIDKPVDQNCHRCSEDRPRQHVRGKMYIQMQSRD